MSANQEAMSRAADVQNLGFVEFTTDLVRNVYTVITDSALEQLKAYGDFVATVSKPLSEYQKEVTGITFNDSDMLSEKNKPKLDSYIEEVLGFILEENTTELAINSDKDKMLESHFSGVSVENKSVIESIENEKISKIDLQKFVYNKLSKSTSESYNMLITVLKLGMNKVEVTDGSISTKLVFHVDSNDNTSKNSAQIESKASSWGVKGSASARWGWGRANVSGGYNSSNIKVSVVNEKSSSAVNLSADIIGSVKINFRSGSFPSYDKN
jgi:hypothetical protein